MRIRQKTRFGVVVALTVIIAVLGVTPAGTIGLYWKTIGDTGIRCTNVGAQVYKSTYSLSSSQMIQVIRSRVHVRTELNGDFERHLQALVVRQQTYSRAEQQRLQPTPHDIEWVLLHVSGEIDGHFRFSSAASCSSAVCDLCGDSVDGDVTGAGRVNLRGHVTSNPC